MVKKNNNNYGEKIVHLSLRSKYTRVTPKFINQDIFLKFILSCDITVIKSTHKPLHTDSYWPALTSQNHHHHQAWLPWPFLKQPPYLWHTSWITAVPNRHTQMAMWAATAVQQTSQKDRGCKQLPIFSLHLTSKQKCVLTEWRIHIRTDLCAYIDHVVFFFPSSMWV